jgi:hypothetical protein
VDGGQRRAAAGELGLGQPAQLGPGIGPGTRPDGRLTRDERNVGRQRSPPRGGQTAVRPPEALERLGELEAIAAHLVLG